MRSDKLSAERIDEILAILDELKASGMKAEVFAQSKGLPSIRSTPFQIVAFFVYFQ